MNFESREQNERLKIRNFTNGSKLINFVKLRTLDIFLRRNQTITQRSKLIVKSNDIFLN